MPQRTAHGLVGRLVRKALDRGVRLADLPLAEFQRGRARAGRGRLRACWASRQAVAAMTSYGSTAPEQVRRQVERWKQRVTAR